jgi:ABC-type antimicrobial peptide transport system permease subunit
VAQETLGAFELNAFMLIGLSVGVFLLVHFFSARRRLFEFSLLRAAGMSTRQLLTLLTLEGGIMMGLGLAAGTAVGAGLARIMHRSSPAPSASALGGEALVRILVNWLQVSGYYAPAARRLRAGAARAAGRFAAQRHAPRAKDWG